MRPTDRREFPRNQPSASFRIHTAGGQFFNIVHPDQAIVLSSRIMVGVGNTDGALEHLQCIALVHIVRIEALQSDVSQLAS